MFSSIQGTAADKMDGQIAESEKSARSERLIEKEKVLESEFRERALKNEEKVLFEEITQIDGKKYITGYNERYIRIAVSAENIEDAQNKCNKIISVKIIGKVNNEVVLAELNEKKKKKLYCFFGWDILVYMYIFLNVKRNGGLLPLCRK